MNNIICEKDSFYETTTPAIYVACLASYNNGKLFGRWIDATQEYSTVIEEIEGMLKASPEIGAEEWAVHDCINFYGLKLSEYPCLEEIIAIAQTIDEYNGEDASKGEIFVKLLETENCENAIKILEEDFAGCYQSDRDFIENFLDETCFFDNVSESIKNYFDYDSYYHDLEYGGEIFKITVDYASHYYFWNR